ncbi:pSer/pThr/pTyr-binding forkhead associated (FHA) protein [Antricoccus suffuscus]|uniref:PSer/pThr/pTyr-binding forkhead associated (FHA) protein n=1 Tax=Antricoccus suffuscus TaxID=1629062 RepID=A0A2T1A4K8_9ACTN|nr:FHA domain-containing protein [Antricoccus suffuscus]PRZ43437.1 pSer/pThr/pTyr-binding forkhead associated (FHA) protein [Antricoccus suffuscus]
MSQRYEITPGPGLVARHSDSILWVGSDLAPEAWDALGAVLDVVPGTDPSGAETAASLESLAAVLREHPATTFAALIISEGHAQGILRGPVTVCNTTAVAPATGYEQFGVTVPFEMSEAVYVGTAEATGNHPSIAQLFDLDAGVVPGGGAWVHPITSGHRYASGASGTHSAIDTGTHQASADTPAQPAEAPPAGAALAGAAVAAGGVAAGLGAVAADDQDSDPAPSSDAPTSIPNDPDATQMYTRDDHEDAGDAEWAPTPDSPPAAEEPAGVADSAGVADPAGVADSAGVEDPAAAEPPVASDQSPADLPSLSAPPSPWAMPNVAAGSEATAGAFTPSEDHLQIDLRAVEPKSTVQPLPLIPTAASGAQSSTHRSSVLVFDDGSTFALDHDYVIGRRPERHELVQSGQARPLTVVDPDTVLSGAHAALRLHGNDVYLEDLGSLNGSHIARPGAADWTRVEPFTPERLEPGTRLLFGWTVATYSGGRDQA